jgi:hypothetical protein
MKIEKGTSRIAIVFEHTTLKFPRIKLAMTAEAIRFALQRGVLKDYLTNSEKYPFSLASNLLRGWLENLRERRLSREFTDIIVPTRLSIFGLLNVQDTATDLPPESPHVSSAIRDKINAEIVRKNGGHTIADNSNFGLHHGQLKIRDYGELGLDFLLSNYADQLEQAFAETMAKI